MSILSTLTVKPLLWAVGILLAIILALSGWLVVSNSLHKAELTTITTERDALQQQVDASNTRITELVAINGSNDLVVSDLAERLKQAVGQAQDTARALDKAEAERNAARAARDRALSTIQSERETTYATDSTCGTWGRAAVCGGITDSLFKQWEAARSGVRAEGSGGSQAAAGADQFYPDRDTGAAAAPDAIRTLWPQLQPADGLLQQPTAGIPAFGGAGLGRQTD